MKIKNNRRYYTLLDIVKMDERFKEIQNFSTNYIYELFRTYIDVPIDQVNFYGMMHNITTDDILISLFNNIFFRYKNEYAVVVPSAIDLDELSTDERKIYVEEFLQMLLSKTIDDEDYYYTMLEMLNQRKNNLMDKLSSITTSNSVVTHDTTDTNTLNTTATNTINMNNTGSSVNRVNDTPNYQQATEEQYEGFAYTSQIAKQTGTNNQTGTNTLVNSGDTSLRKTGTDETEGTQTHESDHKYLYEKIFEIQKNYKDLLSDWIKSYRQCFIESYNI